ncbi:MAG: RNase adapter RapZ, partial [Gammaproteobacteria bacterium]|nr:RNase adapter RapZ [Gammaproteobacteria bacterium]
LSSLPQNLERLRHEGVPAEVVFMEANDEVLTKRFSETRRRHPLSSDSVALPDAIVKERVLLSALSDMADLRIDTSFTAVHELRDLVHKRIAMRAAGSLSMQFVSFGYKHGTPRDADFVFDVRCLPNPHWDKELRKHSGKDPEVVDFLMSQPGAVKMADDLKAFLDEWVPRFEAENRSYLCIAVGCTGGHHRSVFIVEQLARHFQAQGRQILVKHRDL